MESIIGLVRTAAPLTSDNTVSKINTYLPAIEMVSTLLGMYSFLNRAQNYAPIQSLNAKTPMEKVSALIANGNIPIGKMLAHPIIANNMDKIMSSVAKGFINNGNLSDMLSSMTKQFSNNQQTDNNKSNNTNNVDFSSLLEAFMPLMNNIMSDNSSTSSAQNDKNRENEENKESNQQTEYGNDANYHGEPNIKNETVAQDEQSKNNVRKNTPINIRQRRRTTTY